jgi:hypothetical protein
VSVGRPSFHRSGKTAVVWHPQMLGYDQIDILAERLLGRIAEQSGRGAVPAHDRSGTIGTDDGIGSRIENPLGQFETLFHGRVLLSVEVLLGRDMHRVQGPLPFVHFALQKCAQTLRRGQIIRNNRG